MDATTLETQDPNITIVGNSSLNTLTGCGGEYDPDHIAFSKLTVNHVPEAECPTWNEFLEYTLPKEEQLTLQELFGYTLVRGYPYQNAFFLLGSGANGKGACMQILRAMLGKRNCSSVALQEVGERFYAFDLYNKYANISGDTSPMALCDASMYKMLTGGDDIRIEQKGKDAIDFRNHAKIISLMNKLMKTGDQSDGFMRRFVLIRFDKVINAERKKEKEGFEQRIIDHELSGVLNWAIEGLIRLRKNGGFTFQNDKTPDDLRKLWNHEADHLQRFIDECCVMGPGHKTVNTVFMKAYNIWHEDVYGTPAKELQKDVTSNRSLYGFDSGPVSMTRAAEDLWLNDIGEPLRSVRCYKGISLKNTPGDLTVDMSYISEYWDKIVGSTQDDVSGDGATNEPVQTIECKPGLQIDDVDNKLVMTFKKLSVVSPSNIGWTIGEITKAYPQGLAMTTVQNHLTTRGQSLGIKETGEGRWKV